MSTNPPSAWSLWARAAWRAQNPCQTIEVLLGIVLLIFLTTDATPRAVIGVWLTVASDATVSLAGLLQVDTSETAWSVVRGLGRIVLASLPAALLIRTVPPHRRLWLLAFVGCLIIVSSPLSVFAITTPGRWLLLAFASTCAAFLTRVRFLRWSALLPFVLLWEIVPSHSLMGMRTADPQFRKDLLSQCAKHDGVRPTNLTANRVIPYHGINSLGDDLVLLSGEGGDNDGHGRRRVPSWWLRRKNGDFQFELPSDASGNLWRGCVLDGTIWMARANYLVGATRQPVGSPNHEEVRRLRLPSDDTDFGETACVPERNRVYVTEGTKGGMWEVSPDGRETHRYEVGGVWVLPKRRVDGRLVISNTARLMVFDPELGRVVAQTASALVSFGFDLCATNGTAAVADTAGRLRIFEVDSLGSYRFVRGISLPAPRRVAYSRDCSRIAVTSGDYRVFIVDAELRQVIDELRVGPALREVAATGPREFSIADACSLTTYRW